MIRAQGAAAAWEQHVAPIFEQTQKQADAQTDVQTPSTSTPVAGPIAGDYYEITGPAQRTYTASEGVISYCPLDELDRATCAFGELTPALRAEAQARGRQDITVDPAGWPSGPAANREVTISALDDVSGSESYSGWFWNRSHLIADSLGADAVAENLVTGTRTQNVGSTQSSGQYAGGMAFTELIARDYLDSADASGCALYYPPTCGRPVTSVALAGE